MCYFITLAVPGRHAAAVAVAPPRGLAIHPTSNASLKASLPAGYEMFLITCGGCSCELYGRAWPEQAPDRDDHLRRKYAERGWSKAKIERACAQSRAHKKHLQRQIGYRADVVDFVKAIVTQASTGALLAHMYDADVEDARFQVGPPLRIDPAGLAEAQPEPDQWLWIRQAGNAERK